MSTTGQGASDKSGCDPSASAEETTADSRMVTEAEREDLIQDAKAFRTSHEMTFQLLSDGDNQPPREVD